MIKVKPDPNCKYCHGSGEVLDWVDYGSTTISMPSLCNCVEIQIHEDYEGAIELDLSENRNG